MTSTSPTSMTLENTLTTSESRSEKASGVNVSSLPKDSPADSGGDKKFDKGIEFLLSCMGMSVGLGNIWRFPTRVYENGGSAFLIPYILSALFFGLPGVYLEFALGQYQGKSPPFVYRRIMPILEGFGWVSATLAVIVGVYFMLIISWISVYLYNVVIGNSEMWSTCDNAWNDAATCFNIPAQKLCAGKKPAGWNLTQPKPERLIYMEGKCRDFDDYKNVSLTGATEQYFNNFIINPSSGLTDFNSINWPILISMSVCWVLTAILILKGMKLIGKISYITVILPYIIILVLFIRGVTLDGASEGLHYFLMRTDFSALGKYQTWTAALTQLCFSLSIGFGGLMNISAYNKKHHNCYRDAIFLILGDTAMSLIGGAAVFSTLGFLAKQRGVSVPEVVKSGPSLAFVAYPDAMNQMPLPWLWSALFFVMLFLLGISTEMVIVEVMCSCIGERFAYLRNKRWLVVTGVCSLLFAVGIILTTDAGIFWFELFDEYGSGFGAVLSVTVMCIMVSYVYGLRNFKLDVVDMLGEGNGSAQVFGMILMVLAGWRSYPFQDKPDVYPPLFDIAGWCLTFFPFLMIPLCAYLSYRNFKEQGIPTRGLVMIQKQHSSFSRISSTWSEEKKAIADELPATEPGQEEEEEEEDGESEMNSF
ncbi:unnamed protein product [Caenorhabditis sp. 36 PRJEB53466]|nr:unnamed protein product [Caenorhabditis sp. 36 PRJEB53466]